MALKAGDDAAASSNFKGSKMRKITIKQEKNARLSLRSWIRGRGVTDRECLNLSFSTRIPLC
jgi:hypothetical protein